MKVKGSGGMKRPPLCEKEGALKRDEVQCPICWSILIQPVTMPCRHALCLECFKQHVEETSLQCPCCRMRLSVWSRKANKDGKLLDVKLWARIQKEFPKLVDTRLCGQDSQALEPLDLISLADREESNDSHVVNEKDTVVELIPIKNGAIDGVMSASKGAISRELEAMMKQHQDDIQNERRQEEITENDTSELVKQLQDAGAVPQPVDPSIIATNLEISMVKRHQDDIENERRQKEITATETSEHVRQPQDVGAVPQPVDPSIIATNLEISMMKRHQDDIENERRQEEITATETSEHVRQPQDVGAVPQPVDPPIIATDSEIAKKLAQQENSKATRLAEINASRKMFAMPSQTPPNNSTSYPTRSISGCTIALKREFLFKVEEFSDMSQLQADETVEDGYEDNDRESLHFKIKKERDCQPPEVKKSKFDPNSSRLLGVPSRSWRSVDPNSSRLLGVPSRSRRLFDPNSSRLLGVRSRKSFDPNSSRILGVVTRRAAKKVKARSSVAGMKADKEKMQLAKQLEADRKLAERMQKLLDSGKNFTPPRSYPLRTRWT